MKTHTGTERAHSGALLAFLAAVRANDLPRAERWLRCAERCHRLHQLGRRDAEHWKRWKREVAESDAEHRRRMEENRRYARERRAAEHRRRLAEIAGGATTGSELGRDYM